MFKSKNKIIPEETLNRNDPIQARMLENIRIINKSKKLNNLKKKKNNMKKKINN